MERKIIEILHEIRPEFDFTEPTDFIEEGMLDSFDVVRLVFELDKEFDTSIDGEDILPQNFSTVQNIISLLYKNGVK